jgi:hypothetical protein
MTPEERRAFWRGYRLGRLHTGRLVRRLAHHFEDEFSITEVDARAVESDELQDIAEQDVVVLRSQ